MNFLWNKIKSKWNIKVSLYIKDEQKLNNISKYKVFLRPQNLYFSTMSVIIVFWEKKFHSSLENHVAIPIVILQNKSPISLHHLLNNSMLKTTHIIMMHL